MKVLLINGSLHDKGSTFAALEIIAEELKEQGIESTIFQLGTEPIRGCSGCRACSKLKKCIVDDVVNRAIEILDDYDGMIVGSPVHYASASGAITAFMDRLFYSSGARLKHKPAAAVAVCRRGGSTATLDQLNKYFTINEMPVISSCYWNQIHGNSKEEILQDLEGVKIMRVLARNIAYQLKLEEAGKKAGVTLPEPVEKVFTNFIR